MKQAPTLLLLDEDAELRQRLVRHWARIRQGRLLEVADSAQALRCLREQAVHLVLASCEVQPAGGLAFLRQARALYPDLPIIMTSRDDTVAMAVKVMREGATDFLVKPFAPEAVIERIQLWVKPLSAQATPLANSGMIAEDSRSMALLELAQRVAQSEATVLLNGESGVGKEVVARFIHRHSARSRGPFVAVNCAAIPENMLEATLFGHERGAFTGAYEARPGKFEQAQGGTLLLDEISEMDLNLQSKLLRVLQEREVERLGGRRALRLDVRVLATSNRNLLDEVQAGRFREDLFYRLSVFPLWIPPLRERPGDIVPLAQHFLLAHSLPKTPPVLQSAAAERLLQHPWPGNVRELDNVIQRALILSQDQPIHHEAIRFEVVGPQPIGDQGAPVVVHRVDQPARQELGEDLRSHEERLILDALQREHGRRKAAADRLGISPRTLRYKLARLRDAGVAIPSARS